MTSLKNILVSLGRKKRSTRKQKLAIVVTFLRTNNPYVSTRSGSISEDLRKCNIESEGLGFEDVHMYLRFIRPEIYGHGMKSVG